MSTTVSAPPSVEELYQSLDQKVRAQRPAEDVSAIERAYQYAATQHGSQKRVSGEPFMIHPLAVTNILADMHMDLVCLQTGLLHDVVEDTGSDIGKIKSLFGEDVARCVDGLTKLRKIDHADREERQAESLRKMLLAMTT